jgi:hypothetical protein
LQPGETIIAAHPIGDPSDDQSPPDPEPAEEGATTAPGAPGEAPVVAVPKAPFKAVASTVRVSTKARIQASNKAKVRVTV